MSNASPVNSAAYGGVLCEKSALNVLVSYDKVEEPEELDPPAALIVIVLSSEESVMLAPPTKDLSIRSLSEIPLANADPAPRLSTPVIPLVELLELEPPPR